ncbi:MAG: 50S ribosomal protein L1 [Candidatus Latescibacteria bacterium]|jgi:large subunit ribosomal protein L1|nr:50S ribosomal protein L1 [Candidatus Latescibacterota bacterium]|tara:strand:+ start:551 stop:1252 length:702 start_codon:yes stop_codon:yes gene_type:complete
MGKRGKKYAQSVESYERSEPQTLEDAIKILKAMPVRKFDETVELNFNLGIDGRQADQALRGTVMLPNGTGKEVRIVVITQGELVAQAEEAGADHVGAADLIAKIEGGWLDFDLVISSPDMMGQVGKLGRVLGPRGLMPNPKTGTVTRDVGQAVTEARAGRVEYRADNKSGNNAQAPIGKLSFTEEALVENAQALSNAILRAKPASTKGSFIRKLILSSTMGPGIRIDPGALAA